jgi:hypothetical protein
MFAVSKIENPVQAQALDFKGLVADLAKIENL